MLTLLYAGSSGCARVYVQGEHQEDVLPEETELTSLDLQAYGDGESSDAGSDGFGRRAKKGSKGKGKSST